MFNFGIYLEGLRRTKVYGVIVLAIMIIGAVLIPIVTLYNHARLLEFRVDNPQYRVWVDEVLSRYGADVVSVMAITAIIATPLVTLSVFSWLNSRKSSDFYHAIPHKRETLFISFLASALTWTVLSMWITTAVATMIYAFSPNTDVNYGSILIVLLGFTLVILLITGAIMLAMSFTGTTFSNIATTALILFFPRGLMAFYTAMVAERASVISSSDFGIISDHGRNLLFGMTSGSGTLSERMLYGMLYTTILVIVYFIGAGYFFKKRHSEIATHAGTKWSQPITRVIITFIATMPVLIMAVAPAGRVEPVTTIIIFIIAIIAYYFYEYLTNRNVGSLWSTSKGIGFVLVLNLLFIGAVMVNTNVILREVDVTRVTSIQQDNVMMHWNIGYASLHQQAIEITDLNSIEMLVEVLNSQIENRRTLNQNDSWHWASVTIRLTFTLDNGRTITRNLRAYNHEGGDLLQNFFRNYEPYLATYRLVPTAFEHAHSWYNLTDTQYEHVLTVLREELQTVDIHAWYERVGRFSNRHRSDWVSNEETGEWYDPWQAWRDEVFTEIHVSGEVDGQRFWNSFPVTEDLTPRTLALYQSYLSRGTRD